jgi:IS5 family transposase
MKPRPKPQDSAVQELFRAKLRDIINLQHELMRLGELIDWEPLETHFAVYHRDAGGPGLPIRLVVRLHAYEKKDRKVVESSLANDFVLTNP